MKVVSSQGNSHATSDCQVAAGITAASGISAELGIPLTHRGAATSVAFITGHAREGGEDELDETVTASADKHTTLVVYMGLNTLPALLERLRAAGLPPETPAAAVERGTTLHQRAVYAPLQSLTQVYPRKELLHAVSKVADNRGFFAKRGSVYLRRRDPRFQVAF